MAVQLEAIPTAPANGRPDWTWDRRVGPSRKLGSSGRPRLHASLRPCGRSRRLPGGARGREAPSGTRFGAARLQVSSRWGRVGLGLRRGAFVGVQRRFAHHQNGLPFFCYSCFFSEWLRADAHGAAGCAPSLAYTVRVLVGAEQTLREPQWVPQSVKRVHGRPPPASLQASAVWPDLAGPLPEVMLFRGAGRTPCTRRGVRQGARGPPPAARATLPGEERGVSGQPQSGCTRPAREPEPRFPRRPPAPPRRWSAVWALLSLPTPGRFLSRVSWAIRAAGGLVQGFERCARVQAP